MQKTDRDKIISHVREECVKDPLYLAKMMLAALGKNIFWTVLRIAGYILVIYLAVRFLDKKGIDTIIC